MSSDSKLKPVKEFRISRRNLPHYEYPGNVYFITFNTLAGYELDDVAKDIVLAAVRFHADKKYKLFACVVMKTHVHLILLPLEESKDSCFSLAQIIHSIKSYSAHEIQRILKKKSTIWLDEHYDNIVRDDDDLLVKMNYIVNNPLKAGLVEKPEYYKWLVCEGIKR